MDNVLVGFASVIARFSDELQSEYDDRLDEVSRIFSLMDPIPNAIESYDYLAHHFDTYILSTAPKKIMRPSVLRI
jgi:hypothetical protein